MKRAFILKNILLNTLASAAFAGGVLYVFMPASWALGSFVIACIISFAALWVFNLFTRILSSTLNKSAVFFAIIFTFCMNIGKSLYVNSSFSHIHDHVLLFIISMVGFFAVAYSVTAFLLNLLKKEKSNKRTTEIKWQKFLYNMHPMARFAIIWGLIFALWLPIYLAFYPGVFSYDILSETLQIKGVYGEGFSSYNMSHPPLHTFFWALCLKTESVTGLKAIVIYSITQMLLLSGTAAKVLHLMFSKRVRFWIIIVSFLFFSLNPVISVFSFSTARDVCFAAFLALTVIDLIYLIKEPGQVIKRPGFWVSFILHCLATLLFRNNAVYVFIILIPIAVITLRKYWKRIIPLLVIPVLIFYLFTKVIYPGMGISKGSLAEAASVPAQQISKAVNRNDPVSYKEDIDKFLSYNAIKVKYNRRYSDPVKATFKTDYFNENYMDFYKTWFSLMKKYPYDYATAFLDLNLPYWYPLASSVDRISARMYIEIFIQKNEYYHFERKSFFPQILNAYIYVINFKAFSKIPAFINIFSLPFPIWFLLFCFCALMTKKRGNRQMVISPYFLLWLTYIVGPVSNFRYIFPIIFAYPLILALIFDTDNLTNEESVKEDEKNNNCTGIQ